MAREKSNYYVTLGGNSNQKDGSRLAFRSYTDIYKEIRKSLGVEIVQQKGSAFLVFGKCGELIPRLRLKLSGGNIIANQLTNAAQTDGKGYVTVFCDPFNLEKAFKELVGKNCKGKEIAGVRIPKRRVYV
jgi:hypothetical protein